MQEVTALVVHLGKSRLLITGKQLQNSTGNMYVSQHKMTAGLKNKNKKQIFALFFKGVGAGVGKVEGGSRDGSV